MADDGIGVPSLQSIKGIKDGVQSRLLDVGIDSVQALANADPDELYETLEGLPGRTREKVYRWVGAAKDVAPRFSPQPAPSASTSQDSYIVTVASTPEGDITRTTVRSVPSKNRDARTSGWDGWAAQELVSFIEREYALATESTAETAEANEDQLAEETSADQPAESAPDEHPTVDDASVRVLFEADEEAQAADRREQVRRLMAMATIPARALDEVTAVESEPAPFDVDALFAADERERKALRLELVRQLKARAAITPRGEPGDGSGEPSPG